MSGPIDITTLGWVKKELDETLKQARQALEAYVENPDDESQLRFCSVHLHQVFGTLQMVELYGASMLAEELEKLVLALLDGKIAQKESAYELIMSGVVQLPDYLDRLSAGHRDVPLVLMPILNDLRAIRGDNLLSENALFNPDLNVALPDSAREGSVNEDLQSRVKAMRHQYQVALLGWFRDKDVSGSLAGMCETLAAFQAASKHDAVLRLWWVAGATVQALAKGLLDVSMATKLLLGQVDRQMKRVIDAGEQPLIEQPALDLLKNLLFYVARARRGASLVDQVKDTWRLDVMLPDADEIAGAQQSLTGHNLDLMVSVSLAVREDLDKVKDILDVFMRGNSEDKSSLESAADNLQRIGDTLGMLGLGALRKRMCDQAQITLAMASGETELDENRLMDVAGSLLFVESSLDALVKGDISGAAFAEESGDAGNSVVPEAEFQQVRGVVANEAIRDIAQAKEAIIAYIETPDDFDKLEQVPALFNQIKGGMLLLNEERVAAVLDGARQFIKDSILTEKHRPQESQLNNLADAISAVEYYLENLREQKAFSGDSLSVAEKSLVALGIEMDLPETAEADEPAQSAVNDEETIEISLGDFNAEAAAESVSAADEEIISIGVEAADEDADEEIIAISLDGADDNDDVIAISLDGADDNDDVIAISLDDAGDEDVISISLEETAAPTGEFATPYPVLDNDDLDEEILEIFLEEAEEEINNIREFLPRWIANADDEESLTNARRSFHTLKGSGRLVGAMLLGEFAWAFENMFNRVLDGTVQRSDAMLDLLTKAMDALPELKVQLEEGPAPSWDVLAMMPLAEALSRGEEVVIGDLKRGSVSAAAPAVEEDVAQVVDTEASSEEDVEVISLSDMAEEEQPVEEVTIESDAVPNAGIDPVLYDIFNAESQDHLQAIRAYLAEAANDERLPISEDLIRAVHTLHGSARMAGADEIAEVASEMERFTKALLSERIPMVPAAQATMARAVEQVEAMLPMLTDRAAELPDYNSMAAELAELPRTADALGIEPFAEDADLDEAEIELEEEPEVIETITVAVSDNEPEAVVEEPIEIIAASASAESAAGEADYDDADDELIEVFLEEADEIMENSEATLLQWIEQPDDQELMAAMQRDLHTLKGGARMADLTAIGNLTHSLESLLIAITDGQVQPSDAIFERLQLSQDRLVHMLEAVKARKPIPAADDLIADADALRRGESVAAVAAPAVAKPDASDEGDDEIEVLAIPRFEKPAPKVASEEKPAAAARGQQEQVRIRADLLDAMVNNAGEISIYRSRLEQQVGITRFNLNEMTQTVMRLRDQLRKMEIETEAQVVARHEREFVTDEAHPDFDPLEMDRYSTLQTLSRAMMESINDLTSIQGMLEGINRESETLLVQQSRVNTELQEGLMRTRMVPFSGLAPRMRRIVRQVCQELGKRAELVLEGAEGEMDRAVIDRITAPLEHMLRNAIAHGIEYGDEREKVGKDKAGTITLTLMRDAADVVIRLSDDGRGMSLERIREKAIEKGMMTADAQLTDNDIMQFVLETGFSTADEVSQVAGRGVGMDVVNSEVKQLGGSLHIDSQVGKGTTFTIRLPFTLAISQALMVQVHEDIYAIPLTSIEGVVRMSQEQLQKFYAEPDKRFSYAGFDYEVRHLGTMLGHGEPLMGAGAPKRYPVLLVRAGDHHMALQIENLLGSRETVVKSVGPQISSVRGISGATILGDGRVVFILDLGGLVRAGAVTSFTPAAPVSAPVVEQSGPPLVMVVDDSITVRKVTTRLLERNDMQSVTAKDGVDAIAKLQEHMPDVMLLDIEMPRMDGFELATHIRNEPRLKHIPIIMITSRTGEKHRNRAMDIGVNRYLGKPYQESDLLDNIKELLAEKTQNA